MLTTALLVVLTSLVASLWLWMKHRHAYWRKRKVPGPAPSIPFGNCTQGCLGRRAVYEDYAALYEQHKHEPYLGIFYMHTPLLILCDLDIIRQVLVKEFPDFNGRGMYSDPDQDPITGHLFILSGQPWRNLRVKLSPAFSSGKVKYYFNRVKDSALNMQKHVDSRVSKSGGSYREDVRELIACYSTDIVASLILGLESDSISQETELRAMGRKTFDPSLSQGLRFQLAFFGRDIMSKFKINLLNPSVNEFFYRIVSETVGYREKHNVERADLLNLLIQLKNKGFVSPDTVRDACETQANPEDNLQKLSLTQIVAQVFIFYIAGFETTSSTTSFTLYELAKHPDILRRVMEEVDRVMKEYNGEITYESVASVPYMEKVISETLRLYPPVPFLTREVMKRRTLPNTDLVLEAGQSLVIPINAIHRDPDFWPNPDTFDPERFSDENKASIRPMSYMPFGDGPRICIGMRLGMVQVKAALMALLSRFTVSPCPDTPDKIRLEPWSIVPAPKGGLPVSLSRRTSA